MKRNTITSAPIDSYRQGELDGLCGIYVIINAYRRLFGDKFSHERCTKIFMKLARAAPMAVFDGLSYRELLELIMLANVNRGPWLGGMFLEKKAEALDMYLKATLLDPQEVSKHMEVIAFDLGQDVANDIDVGQVHQAIAGLLDCRTFFNKSMSLEMKRWFSLT